MSHDATQKALTIQQVADLLNVSEPFVLELLRSGQIAEYKAESQQVALLDDVRQYKSRSDEECDKAAQALVDDAQELGMGY